jgi:hypothetical protein
LNQDAVTVLDDRQDRPLVPLHLFLDEGRNGRIGAGHGLQPLPGVNEHHSRVAAVDRSEREVEHPLDRLGDGGFLMHRQSHPGQIEGVIRCGPHSLAFSRNGCLGRLTAHRHERER